MTTTSEPTSTRSLHGGEQRKYRFDNGYGASVVRHRYSYGGDEGLFELAVLGPDDHLVYDTPVTNDVLGYLTDEDVQATLLQIADLEGQPK